MLEGRSGGLLGRRKEKVKASALRRLEGGSHEREEV